MAKTETNERKFTGCIAKYYTNHAFTMVKRLDDLRRNLKRFEAFEGDTELTEAFDLAEEMVTDIHNILEKRTKSLSKK